MMGWDEDEDVNVGDEDYNVYDVDDVDKVNEDDDDDEDDEGARPGQLAARAGSRDEGRF